jgi:hypothetical protein
MRRFSKSRWRPRANAVFCLALALLWLLPVPSAAAFAAEPEQFYLPHADLLPGFAPYLAANPLLLEGGGILLSEPDGEWLALGVGAAFPARPQGGYELWRLAGLRAQAALAEALTGLRYSGQDAISSHAEGEQGSGQVLSLAREETAAVISAAREAGRWRSEDGKGCFVLRAVFSPLHPLLQVRREMPAREVELEPEWRGEFLSRPFLRRGGADVALVGNQVFLLVTGWAPIRNDNSAARITAFRLAQIKARAELIAFCEGARVSASRETLASQDALSPGDEGKSDIVSERLKTRSAAQIKGLAGRMRSVGGWLDADGQGSIRAYVVRAEDL